MPPIRPLGPPVVSTPRATGAPAQPSSSAQHELAGVSFADASQKAARQAELDRDLAAMRALLASPP